MKFTAFALIVALGLLTAPLAAEAQQPTRVPRIGILCAVFCPTLYAERLPEEKAFVWDSANSATLLSTRTS